MSKSTYRRASQLTPEQRHEQLLRCAVSAFAQNGIGRANHAQVAKLAGVAVPTVFTYFPTRESLVDTVLAEIERVLLGIVRTETENHDITAFQKLLNLLSNYIDSIDEYPDLAKVFLDWTTSFENSLANKFRIYLDKLTALLGTIIEEGRNKNEFGPDVNPLDAALMIYSSANVLAQIRFYNIEVDAKHYIINLITSVLHLNLDNNAKGELDERNYKNQRALTQWSNNGHVTSNRSEPRQATTYKWKQHVAQWKKSGLPQSTYCRTHNIKPSTFSYWVKKAPPKA